jgi:hypothetical protein
MYADSGVAKFSDMLHAFFRWIWAMMFHPISGFYSPWLVGPRERLCAL